MQQLSQFGSVANDTCAILLRTLQALAGALPREVQTNVLVFEPKYPFKPQLAAGEVNQIEQYRIFAMCESEDPIFYNERNIDALKRYEWELQVQEVPESGRGLKVIMQQVIKSRVKQGDLFKTLDKMGYQYASQYISKGYDFFIENLSLRLFRLYTCSSKRNSIELADDTGQWTIKSWVDVEKLTDLPAIETATNILETFQQEVKPLVAMSLPNRLQFDTRIRKKAPLN